ncbi:MAG: hypothetical protein EU536_02000, partial [Promethearchaeota archaeon]
ANIYEKKIPITPETSKLCQILNLNPLKLISSGTLVITAKSEYSDRIIATLHSNGIPATFIGEIKQEKTVILHRTDGTQEIIAEQNQDQLWNVV